METYKTMREPVLKGLYNYIKSKGLDISYETVKTRKYWWKPSRKYRQYIIEYFEIKNDDTIQYLNQDMFKRKFL